MYVESNFDAIFHPTPTGDTAIDTRGRKKCPINADIIYDRAEIHIKFAAHARMHTTTTAALNVCYVTGRSEARTHIACCQQQQQQQRVGI